MAEKELKTRIQLKYDTLENWTSTDPVLYSGEIAIVAIPGDSASTVAQVTKPAIVFKVGDGTTTFNELPYASGLAADVYAWAKAAHLDLSVLTAADNGQIDYTLVKGLDDDITGLLTTYIEGLLESDTFAETVIGDVQDTVDKAIAAAEEYTDAAIQTLGSASVGDGKYITGISVNETGELTLTEVELDTTPTENSQKPITSGGVYTAIKTAVETAEKYTDEAIAGVVQFQVEVVDSYDNLPSEGKTGVIYLVPCNHTATSSDKDSPDTYDEYIWASSEETYEKIGNTDIDLTDYATTEALKEAITTASEKLTADAEAIKTELEGEITTLTENVAAVSSSLEELSSSVNTLSSTVEEQTESISSLQTTVESNTSSISALDEQINGGEEEDIGIVGQIEGIEDSIKDIQTTLHGSDDDDDSGLVGDVSTLQEEVEALQTAVDDTRTYDVTSNVTGEDTKETATGLKITPTVTTKGEDDATENKTTFNIELDDDVVFVFNCGNAEGYDA